MRVTDIFRHPVKSLGSERIAETRLETGAPLPHDRIYALAHGRSRFDPAAPAWAPCSEFVRIANLPELAALRIAYDPASGQFQAADAARGAIEADLGAADGRAALAAYVEALAAGRIAGPFRIAEIGGGALTDWPEPTVSLKSRVSLRALEARMGADLDPRRFRGNLWIDGEDLAPWAEAEWIGRDLAIGEARLRVVAPIERCMATAANPSTGERDLFPVSALTAALGEPCFGVLARVVAGGAVAEGAPVRLL